MSGSKEPFDEVIFIELPRDDAQRNLDEMKRMLPRSLTPSYVNFSSQNASSTSAVAASSVDPRAWSSMAGPPFGAVPGSAATYGRGAHNPLNLMHQQAPWTVRSFQSPIGNQCQIYSSYPSAPDQHQMPSNYLSNPNQYQVHAGYQSTPLPGYGQSTYDSYGSPSPYCPSNIESQQRVHAPMSGKNLFQTPGSAEASGASGYEATNLIRRQLQVHPSTVPAYGSYPVDQQVAHQGTSSSWSSYSYRSYGQHSHGVHNSGPQYGPPALAPRPPHGATPSNVNPLLTPWHC